MTIYDLEVVATWKGKVGDEEVKGKVTVPEVSHEAIDGLSDYQVSPPNPHHLNNLHYLCHAAATHRRRKCSIVNEILTYDSTNSASLPTLLPALKPSSPWSRSNSQISSPTSSTNSDQLSLQLTEDHKRAFHLVDREPPLLLIRLHHLENRGHKNLRPVSKRRKRKGPRLI